MTGADAVAAFGPFLPLTLPLSVVAGLAIAWWSSNRSTNPPRFTAYAVRVGWMVDPAAWLDRDLRHHQLSSGIAAVLHRLLYVLSERHRLTLPEIFGPVSPRRVREKPSLSRARRAARRLNQAYRLASLAEDPRSDYFWPRWRRPVRRAKARRLFEEELREIGRLWPQLEARQ